MVLLFALPVFVVMPSGIAVAAEKDGGNAGKSGLQFDTMRVGRSEVIVAITLSDGGKVERVTEPLAGRDGKEGGFRKLVGYKLPDGTVVEKDIHRNSDGTVTVLDVDSGAGNTDRHPKRMTADEFVRWVKDNEKQK